MNVNLLAVFFLGAIGPKPVVLWVSEPVRPGQTVLVFGDGFERSQRVGFKQGARHAVRAVLQNSSRSIKAFVPKEFVAGPFELLVDGTTVHVNRPKILWTQCEGGTTEPKSTDVLAGRNDVIRMFGTGLSWTGSKPFALFEPEAGPSSFRVNGQAQDGFSLDLRVPSSAAAGRYRIRVNSGTGGADGWTDPIRVTVRHRQPAAEKEVLVTSFGASGLDGLDDTSGVLKAIRFAGSHGGGIIKFPRGRFVLNRGLELPPKVSLKGAGIDLTALCWSDSAKPPVALISGSHDFAVEDMTMYAINHGHGIASDQGPGAGGNVRVVRVRMRMNPYRGHLTEEQVAAMFSLQQKSSTGGADCLRLGGPNLTVTDCDIAGGGRSIYLSGARNSIVARNRFANGRWGWYCISGSDGLIFEDNIITNGDLMSTGGGLNCLDGSMVSQNVYFARNHIGECPGWDREAMTSDAGGAAYYGRVSSAKGTELTLASKPDWNGRDWQGAGVFVLDGHGQGQYRQILHASGQTVLVGKPWTVMPNASSVITITMVQRNYLFIDNVMDEAGVAIQLYGTAVGHIASGNVSKRTDGFHNFGMNYYGVQPSWFVQWLDNRIEGGNVYAGGHDQTVSVGEAHLGSFAMNPAVEPKAPVTLCSILRGNRLNGNAHLGVGGTPDSPDADYPFTQEAIVEGNRVRDASCGLLLSIKGATGVLVRDNDFSGCDVGVTSVSPEATARHARLQNLLRQVEAGTSPLFHLPLLKDLADASGEGFDAAASGAGARIVADSARQACLELDGKSRCEIPGSELLNLETFTMSFWVKPERLVGRFGFVAKRNASEASPFIVGCEGDRLSFEATDISGHWSFNFLTDPVLKAGVWQRIKVIKEAGKGVTLYLDGKAVGHMADASPTYPNDSPIEIGWEAWGGDPADSSKPSWFRGRISDIELWPKVVMVE